MTLEIKNNFKYICIAVLYVFSYLLVSQAAASERYRFIINVSNFTAGSPVLVDVDFARYLLKDNKYDSINPRALEVQTFPGNQTVPSMLCLNRGSLAHHYQRNQIVRFKAVDDVNQYVISFELSNQLTPPLPPDYCQLGIGETLYYNYQYNNFLWGRECGKMPFVSDADNDGDWDIHSYAFDGGRFILRNIGTNQSPVFLPPARYARNDDRIQPPTSPYLIDWDNDGMKDRLTYLTFNEPSSATDKLAEFDIEFNVDGVYGAKQKMVDPNGQVIQLERAALVSLSTMDINGDGLQDILACSANNYIVVYLNRGMVLGCPKAERVLLPITGDDGAGFANNPYLEDSYLQALPFDWNSSGKKDLIITGWNHRYLFLENQSSSGQIKLKTAVWFKQKGGPISHDYPAPVMLDWDGDGDMDLMVGGVSGQILYCENTGTRTSPEFLPGYFMKNSDGTIITINAESTNGTIQGSGETYWGYLTLEYTDWDNDEDFDFIINDSLGRLSWIENIGSCENGLLSSEVHRFSEVPDTASCLEGYWKFNGNFVDSSGNGNNLSFVGSGSLPVYSSNGYYDGCFIFDNATIGQTQCLSANLITESSSAFTATAWINPSSLESGFSDVAPHTIVKLYNTVTTNVCDLRIRDGKLDVYYTNPGADDITSAEIPLNQWSFVAVSHNQNILKIYLNGELVHFRQTSGNQSYNYIYIGNTSPTANRGFCGKMDEIRFYKRELTDVDIAILYNSSCESCDNITTLWRNRPGVGDFTGDGIAEIIAMETAGRLVMYEKTSGSLNVLSRVDYIRNQQSIPIILNSNQGATSGRVQLDVADWDGDGDLDIIAGGQWALMGRDSSFYFLENVGSNSSPVFNVSKFQARGANFIEWSGNNGNANFHAPHPEMVDYNNDGDMDLLVGTESGVITYYEHNYFDGNGFPSAEIYKFEKYQTNSWYEIP